MMDLLSILKQAKDRGIRKALREYKLDLVTELKIIKINFTRYIELKVITACSDIFNREGSFSFSYSDIPRGLYIACDCGCCLGYPTFYLCESSKIKKDVFELFSRYKKIEEELEKLS